MKKTLINALTIFGFITMILSGCDSDWDGEITVTGGTKLPNEIRWIFYQDSHGIDGIETIEVNPKPSIYAENIIRIKTYDSLVDILTVQCNCDKPCNHDSIDIDENEVDKLLKKFDPKFFETKNIIVTELTVGVRTMNVQVNNISKNGIINITETQKFSFSFIEVSAGVTVFFAIEIDSSFITPPSMCVKIKSVSSF